VSALGTQLALGFGAPPPVDLYAPRSRLPTVAEVCAHATAHPIAPRSSAGWWALASTHGGQAATTPVALRPAGEGIERLDGATGAWQWLDADRAGGLVGASIAPLGATGAPAQWPAPKRQMMAQRMPRRPIARPAPCLALLEFALHAVGQDSPGWPMVAGLVARALPTSLARLDRLQRAAMEAARLACAASACPGATGARADAVERAVVVIRDAAEALDRAALDLHDRRIAERRAIPDDMMRDDRRAEVDARYQSEIDAIHGRARRLRSAGVACECAAAAHGATGPVRPPLAYDDAKLWREVGLRAGDAFASAADALTTEQERAAWVALLRGTLSAEVDDRGATP